eukprot:11182096-Lingulodinium_polyedra.AAC.1
MLRACLEHTGRRVRSGRDACSEHALVLPGCCVGAACSVLLARCCFRAASVLFTCSCVVLLAWGFLHAA